MNISVTSSLPCLISFSFNPHSRNGIVRAVRSLILTFSAIIFSHLTPPWSVLPLALWRKGRRRDKEKERSTDWLLSRPLLQLKRNRRNCLGTARKDDNKHVCWWKISNWPFLKELFWNKLEVWWDICIDFYSYFHRSKDIKISISIAIAINARLICGIFGLIWYLWLNLSSNSL